MELAAQREIVVWAHIALDFPGKGSIAVRVDRLLLVAAPPGPEGRACGGAASRQAWCESRGRRPWPASNPLNKRRAPQRPIPARRTSGLATASAHRVDAFRRHVQGPRRPRPVQQPRWRVWLPREPPRASTCRRTHSVAAGSIITIQAPLGERRFADRQCSRCWR